MTRAALPSISQIVQQYGLRASKKFGQHFLFDLNLTAKIVRLSAITSADLVFEIGPGPGGLTRPLLASGANIHVIEMDKRFLPHMTELGQFYDDRLTVHFGDALKYNLDTLAANQPYHIVANLPYNVGTALLIHWLTADGAKWRSMTLMFQREVAQRIVAQTGDANYGRLSILCAAIAKSSIVMQVPATAFTPPPKVESAVVHLTPLPDGSRYANLDGLANLTGLAFGQKRKMLRASLKPLTAQLKIPVSEWLLQHQIEPTARPETVSPAQFMELADSLAEI